MFAMLTVFKNYNEYVYYLDSDSTRFSPLDCGLITLDESMVRAECNKLNKEGFKRVTEQDFDAFLKKETERTISGELHKLSDTWDNLIKTIERLCVSK